MTHCRVPKISGVGTLLICKSLRVCGKELSLWSAIPAWWWHPDHGRWSQVRPDRSQRRTDASPEFIRSSNQFTTDYSLFVWVEQASTFITVLPTCLHACSDKVLKVVDGFTSSQVNFSNVLTNLMVLIQGVWRYIRINLQFHGKYWPKLLGDLG